MKLNKSPFGGLTVEFYRTKIEHLLVNSYKESFNTGELSITQKKSLISLLYKKGDSENLDNWRPMLYPCFIKR